MTDADDRQVHPSDLAIAQRVKELRQAARLSQAEVAGLMTKAGRPWWQSTVYRVEQAKQPLGAGELLDLAAVFGVSPARLLSGDEGLPDERQALERAIRAQIAMEITSRLEVAA